MIDQIAHLEAFLREDPEDAFTRFALALEYKKAGDTRRATRAFEELMRDRPDYVGTYYHAAVLYVEAGHRAQALEVLSKGISVAERVRDTHAASELRSLKLEIELDDDGL